MVELRGIKKYFPSNGVTALENAALTLRSGEVHALLGENGAGKSTLMHILAGYFPPSSGTILVDEKPRHFSAPADALALGIGMVRQHPGFIREFKVWEDCVLGAEKEPQFQTKRRSVFFDPASARKRVWDLSAQWGLDLPLDRPAESLTVGQRQKAAVLALLLRDVKWYIFDEPTAVLGSGESESLLELFRQLKTRGLGVIFITHKLDEALASSDRVTVMSRGATRETLNTKELSADSLKDAVYAGMYSNVAPAAVPPEGRQFSPAKQVSSAKRATAAGDKPVLVISNLRVEPPGLPFIRNVNLELWPGKILGITGVRDSGLETLETAITGFRGRLEGSITLNGREIGGKGVRVFRDAGGAYLGADRLGSNLAPDLPLSESLIIHEFRRARRGLGIFLDMARLNFWQRKIMDMAGIERPESNKANSFSGGMLQRILLAREFAEDASLIVLAEAGSGLDQHNRLKLFEELKTLARGGTAVLLFSTDIEELLPVAGEIMVLRNGILSVAADSAAEKKSE